MPVSRPMRHRRDATGGPGEWHPTRGWAGRRDHARCCPRPWDPPGIAVQCRHPGVRVIPQGEEPCPGRGERPDTGDSRLPLPARGARGGDRARHSRQRSARPPARPVPAPAAGPGKLPHIWRHLRSFAARPGQLPLPAEVEPQLLFRASGSAEPLSAAAAAQARPARPRRRHVGPQRPHEAAADPVHGGRRARPQREG